MGDERWTIVDRYLTELLLDPPPPADAPLPPHEVSPPQGALLELLARGAGARTILEIGTLGGYRTSWLARALPPGGRLVTLEALAREPRVRATAIQTVGGKGYDGFAVAVVDLG